MKRTRRGKYSIIELGNINKERKTYFHSEIAF